MCALAASSSDRRSELLERSRQFAALGESLAAVLGRSRGRLVFVRGEAGVGKTALVSRFCEELGRSARILWSACDALFTPRPLGPLLDVAEVTGGELEELVASGARPHEVAAALMRELRMRAPTILVIEDLHWADEATLDVLKLLVRRIEGVRALVLASYRDEELDRDHPLRLVLGEFASARAVERLKIEPLSPAAVATLAEPHGVNAEELYRKTEGNPFFVTEVLAAGEGEIPDTVRDAVLAHAARLSPGARALLEAAAVVPPPVELWLLETLATDAFDRLEECLTSGMLTASPAGMAFRHELARLAVEESLAPNRRVALHRKALAALADPPAGAPELARLAHHAEAAGDGEAVLEFAPAAAAQAASLGAHQEAAAQYARALRFAEEEPLEARAELLKGRSHECYLTDQADEAVEAQKGAIECYRRLGDRRGEGDALRGLSSILWCPGRVAEAAQAGREAVALLEQLPPGHELAMAYINGLRLCICADDAEGARVTGARTIELAQRLDDTEVLNHALIQIGAMEFVAGAPGGKEKLERGIEFAQQAGFNEHITHAFDGLAWGALRQRSYALVHRYVEAGLDHCTEHGLDVVLPYFLAYRARAELDQGRWSEAVDSAALVLHERCISTFPRTVAFVVLGLVRARRGDPEVWPPLDEALALAAPTGELPRISPVAAARAEVAWLEGEHEAVAEATEAALDLAVQRRASWLIGELACWRWRAGIREEIPPGAAEPYALQMRGEWARAATLWAEIGCPYEAALALADADDDDALRSALAEFQRLGARPAAAIVARRLRKRGARALPRGPRPATRTNPANLTARELEVLTLLAQGLRNAEIAERLFLAPKTVDSHVSAILRKLKVPTRGQASAEAVRLGLAGQDQ
jgi:DNA-binding CsgD family transcriptional regulator/tetratricopeptide (TPR) repeat protein